MIQYFIYEKGKSQLAPNAVRYDQINPDELYRLHFENYTFLHFIRHIGKLSLLPEEKDQLDTEIYIASNYIDRIRRHPKFTLNCNSITIEYFTKWERK